MTKRFVFQGVKIGAIAGGISSFAFAVALDLLFLVVSLASATISLADLGAEFIFTFGYLVLPIGVAVLIGSFTGAAFGFVLGQFRPDHVNYLKICITICVCACVGIYTLFVLSAFGSIFDPITMSDAHVINSLKLSSIFYFFLCAVYVLVGLLISQYMYTQSQFTANANPSSA